MTSDHELISEIIQIAEESQTIEFKRLASDATSGVVEKVIQTIIAFANTEGGTIVLGVSDPSTGTTINQRVFGIEENKSLYDAIGREIQRVTPPIASVWPPKLVFSKEVSRTIALIMVPKSTQTFHSINNHVFVRQQQSNKRLTPHETIQYSYVKGFSKADRELVNVDCSLLDTPTFRDWKFSRKITGDNLKEILLKTGLARKEKNKIKPTLAAILLFAEYPSDLTETKACVRLFHYAGTEVLYGDSPNLISKPLTIHGSIIHQIQEAHEKVLSLLSMGVRVPSGFKNVYQIPERAVKEAITNAIIHRDYYTKRDIEIRIFDDRLEVENPGLFAANITRYNIGKVRALDYRNDLLVKHLREFSEPPNLDQNEGVRAMRSLMQKQNLYPPVYITYPVLHESVRVVLSNEIVLSEWEKVSLYLKDNKYISNQQARSVTGTTQQSDMRYLLSRWVAKGLLVQITPRTGYKKGTKYRLPDFKEISTD